MKNNRTVDDNDKKYKIIIKIIICLLLIIIILLLLRGCDSYSSERGSTTVLVGNRSGELLMLRQSCNATVYPTTSREVEKTTGNNEIFPKITPETSDRVLYEPKYNPTSEETEKDGSVTATISVTITPSKKPIINMTESPTTIPETSPVGTVRPSNIQNPKASPTAIKNENDYIEIPGYQDVNIKKNGFLILGNPEINDVYLKYAIMKNNEEVYISDLLLPGKKINCDTVSSAVGKTDYVVNVYAYNKNGYKLWYEFKFPITITVE